MLKIKDDTGKNKYNAYYFSIDLIFAVFALVALVYAINSLSIKSEKTNDIFEMTKKAHQTLAILDKLYIINTLNQSYINETLSNMYKNSTYYWLLEIDAYRNDSSLIKERSFNLSNIPSNIQMKDFQMSVSVRRIFVGTDLQNKTITNYCVARFYLFK
ncbi:MAG: hypothetical protein N3E37_00545 [Candidatus Micrarchaeota archaeon]|nr:hypothetical protein [Candidatus Micrarchaeota archaeon]